jgi:hypothetical protein
MSRFRDESIEYKASGVELAMEAMTKEATYTQLYYGTSIYSADVVVYVLDILVQIRVAMMILDITCGKYGRAVTADDILGSDRVNGRHIDDSGLLFGYSLVGIRLRVGFYIRGRQINF